MLAFKKHCKKTVRKTPVRERARPKSASEKWKNPVFFNFLTSIFWFATSFFCGSAGGLARRRIFEFLDPFSDWFSSFCDSRNTGFYSVFLFSACLTASFKTSKNLVNYAVLRCEWKHRKYQCFLTLVKKNTVNYFTSSDPHHDISKQLVDSTFVWSFCHGTFAQLTIPIICFTWQVIVQVRLSNRI